jgi:hypothetical protein
MTTDVLMQDLSTLSDAVPLVGKAVSTAVFEAEALQNAAQDLLHEVAEARQYTTVHRAALREALPPFTAHVQVDHQTLESAGRDADGAWHGTRDALDTAEHRLEAGVADVMAAGAHLAKVLGEAGTRVDQVSGAGDAALDRLEHQTHEAEQRLSAAVHAATAETAQLRQTLALAKSTIDEAAQTLAGRLLQICQVLEQSAAHLVEELTTQGREHLEQAQKPVDGLYAYASAGVAEVAERGQRTIAHPVGEAETALSEELGRLNATGDRHQRLVPEQVHDLEEALGKAEAEASVVPEGIRQIDAAAKQAGI